MAKLTVILLFILTSFHLSASEPLGSVVFNGRIVNLFGDGSWRYADTEAHDCDAIKYGVYFCNPGWKAVTPVDPATAMYQIDERHYVIFIMEGLGQSDGVTPELLKQVALEYAAQASNVPVTNIPVHFSESVLLDGKQLLSVAYTGKISQMTVTYVNNMLIGDKFNVQAVVYGVGDLTPELEAHNTRLQNRLRFD